MRSIQQSIGDVLMGMALIASGLAFVMYSWEIYIAGSYAAWPYGWFGGFVLIGVGCGAPLRAKGVGAGYGLIFSMVTFIAICVLAF